LIGSALSAFIAMLPPMDSVWSCPTLPNVALALSVGLFTLLGCKRVATQLVASHTPGMLDFLCRGRGGLVSRQTA